MKTINPVDNILGLNQMLSMLIEIDEHKEHLSKEQDRSGLSKHKQSKFSGTFETQRLNKVVLVLNI